MPFAVQWKKLAGRLQLRCLRYINGGELLSVEPVVHVSRQGQKLLRRTLRVEVHKQLYAVVARGLVKNRGQKHLRA